MDRYELGLDFDMNKYEHPHPTMFKNKAGLYYLVSDVEELLKLQREACAKAAMDSGNWRGDDFIMCGDTEDSILNATLKET